MNILNNIGDKELSCQHYCVRLSDGSKVYRVVCDECIDCDPANYEIEFYADWQGNKIPTPDLTDSVPCDLQVVERYLCIDDERTLVWVNIQPDTMEVISVVNPADLSVVDPSEYASGFLSSCDVCFTRETGVLGYWGTPP